MAIVPETQQDAKLAALAAFLQKAPALDDLRPIWVDNLPAKPFSAGLFPGGRQPVSLRGDLWGRRRVRWRESFALRLALPHGRGSAPANAARLRALGAWVAAESAAGRAPVFGNTDPGGETLAALAGSLETAGDTGVATYCVTLRAEYTELYEGGQT